MTVKDLIFELSKFDDDRVVVLSKDEEGNAYYPLGQIRVGLYSTGDFSSYPDNEEDRHSLEKDAIALYPDNYADW